MALEDTFKKWSRERSSDDVLNEFFASEVHYVLATTFFGFFVSFFRSLPFDIMILVI